MATFMQAVERRRETGEIPASGTLSLTSLHHQFPPGIKHSAKSLMLKMFESVAQQKPWAVILCRFKGEQANHSLENPVKAFFDRCFAPGSGGLVEYWRNVTGGAIDISGSQVFEWVEVDIRRDEAGNAEIGRGGLIDAGKRALTYANSHALNGFFGVMTIYPHNWSNDDPARPAGTPLWQDNDPLKKWYGTWIDGGADGLSPRVNLTPPFDGNITAHEMGHGFGMDHDVGSDFKTHYADPCCIMSQNGPFIPPGWNEFFGPALCLPHLMRFNLMYTRRVYYDSGGWQTARDGITLPLAPISRPRAHANLGIKLKHEKDGQSWDYYLEYVIPEDWNRGVQGSPYLFIRRIGRADVGDTPIYLGAVQLTKLLTNGREEWIEPSGKARFQVFPTNLPGPIIKVTITQV